MTFSGIHDDTLVAISIGLAILASYTALDLAGRVRASAGWARRAWLAAAAIAMGGGIWAMHFVAMLAFSMPGMTVGYDLSLTLVSLLVAMVVTGIAFVSVARPSGQRRHLVTAGLIMGSGVVAMHYMGMAAMRMPATLSYDPAWVAISVLVAIGAATAALWLASRNTRQIEKFAAAVSMGGAVAGMHYAGMKAAIFTPDHSTGDGLVAGVGQTSLAIGVASASFLILFFALVAAMFDRRFAQLAQREANALRASEERFRALYRGTPLPLHALDAEGRIEQVSDTWLTLLSYARDDVVGRPFTNFLTEDSARRFQQEDWPVLMAQAELQPREYRAVTKAGEFRDVVSAARIEHDQHGAFVHVVGGLTDVTERKHAEEALRQAQKMEAVGQLTGGVAHDFNNLLAVIVGNLDLLIKKLPDDPKLQRLAASAMEGAQRGASLTQRLLAFARRQDLRPEAVDLPQLVHGMTDLLQRSLGPMIRVETRFPLDLPPVHADAHQLELAILNLAVNARDAMPDGGKLEIDASSELLDGQQSGLLTGRYVRLSLTDEGGGMDEATLIRATEPFFTTKGVGKGTGLGLSMVHGLAAQSGGRLAIRSAPGHGTSVDLFLPATVKARAERPRSRTETFETAAEPLHVLAVDDDPLVLANTVAQLEELGHMVTQAACGDEALAIVGIDPSIDLVVTDQLMPNMTGTQLCRRIRLGASDMPVLIVSGFAELDGSDGGRFPILNKPFDSNALAGAIARIRARGNVVPLRPRAATAPGMR